jgi:ribose-phosphate pyrophosphokinase
MNAAVALQCLPASTRDARTLGTRLGLPLHEIAVHRFPDHELRVTVGSAATTTILYASLDRPNEKLIALLFAAEALRRGGAARLVLVAPYLGYMRQDVAFAPGEAVSQRVVGGLLAGAVDRVITVDAHLHRTRALQSVFPGIEADNLSAIPAVADTLCDGSIDSRTIIVGPDAESEPWARDLAGRLGLSHVVGEKVRHGDRSVEMHLPDEIDFAGRPAIIIDDIVSSGGTLIACAKGLAARGAASIDAVLTHALFSDTMLDTFSRAGIRTVRSTHSVPHPTNAILLDRLLAAALERELVGAVAARPSS